VSTPSLGGFVTRLRTTLAADNRPDSAVVREYATTRSEDAFDELVRRFAPMVWGVCRRTVGHHQHAEDAFQAVFLVLVRRPNAIRPPAAVGGWLHAVAVHTSLRARTMAHRRRHSPFDDGHETAAASPPERPDPDLMRALDEEIARLPDKLRAVVALCELDGVSRREAAKRLGVAEGTLSSRLAAARKQLAERLRSRGLTLGVGGIAALVGGGTASAVPAVTADVTRTVFSLAEGVIRTMFLSKLKVLTAGVLAALALAAAGMAAVTPATARDHRHARRNAPVPKPADKEGRILFWVNDKPLLLKTDGTELESPALIPKAWYGVGWGNAHVSPDGKRMLFHKQGSAIDKPVPKAAPAGVAFSNNQTTLQILDLDGEREQKEVEGVHLNGAYWMGSDQVYVRGNEVGENGKMSDKLAHWVYDLKTAKRTPLKMPKDFFPRAVSPDGKTMILDEWKMTPAQWHQHAHLWTVGTDKPTPLLELNQSFNNLSPQFSPDGKRVLCKVSHYGSLTPVGNGAWNHDDFRFNNLLVIDLATKKQTVVKEYGEKPEWRIGGFAWSPDGKRIAYVEAQNIVPPQRERDTRLRVMVADPDGKNEKQIYTAEGTWLLGFDWK
jgi:RNA polymerase sigma factor (sigma-70 family)